MANSLDAHWPKMGETNLRNEIERIARFATENGSRKKGVRTVHFDDDSSNLEHH